MSKFKEFSDKAAAEETKEFANGGVELGDEELDGVAGGRREFVRSGSIEGWLKAAQKINEDGSNIEQVAKVHHMDPRSLEANWRWFKENGYL